MKKILLFLGLSLGFISCNALHRGIPKAEKHRIEEAVNVDQIDQEREVSNHLSKRESQQIVIATNPNESEEGASELIQLAPAGLNDEMESFEPVQEDTLNTVITEDPANKEEVFRQAMLSETYGKMAFIYSLISIGGVVLYPALFVGIIGTIIFLRRFKSLEYVSEKGLKRRNSAKRILRNVCIVAGCVLILAIAVNLLFNYLFFW